MITISYMFIVHEHEKICLKNILTNTFVFYQIKGIKIEKENNRQE